MKLFILSAFTVLILSAGCMLTPYRETVYFDIAPSGDTETGNVFFQVADLRNKSGAGSRFQYRNANGQIISDPDNKWIMPPGALVARAIRLALSAPAHAPGTKVRTADFTKTIHVRGELLVFETDMAEKEFCLHARIYTSAPGRKEQFRDCNIRIPLQNMAPESITAAARIAVDEIVKQIKRIR